jgi:histidyl-tRNA synthetase
LGNSQDRSRYKKVLEEYLKKHENELSQVNQEKLKRNSLLRILDSKFDREIIDQSPKILDYLSDESLKYFQGVLEGLKWLNIPFKISPHLVRGLDYYCHTTFEFKNVATESGQKSLGAQVLCFISVLLT